MHKLHYLIGLLIYNFCTLAFAGSDTIIEVIKIKKDIHSIQEISVARSYAEQEMKKIVEEKAGTYIIDSKKLSGKEYTETTSILSAVMVRVDSITYEITQSNDDDILHVLFTGQVSYSQSALDERIRTIDANQEALAKAKKLKSENDLLKLKLASFHKQREINLTLSVAERSELLNKESAIFEEIKHNQNEAFNILRLPSNLLLNAYLTQESINENQKSLELAEKENERRKKFNERERVKISFEKNIIQHNQNLNIGLSIGEIKKNGNGTYDVEIKMNKADVDMLNKSISAISSLPKLDYQTEGEDSFYASDDYEYFNSLIEPKNDDNISNLEMIWRYPAMEKMADGTYPQVVNIFSRPGFDQQQTAYKHSIYQSDIFHRISYKEVVLNQGKQDFCLYKQMIEDRNAKNFQYSVPEYLFVGNEENKSIVNQYTDENGVILYAKIDIAGSQVILPFLSIEPSKAVGFRNVVDYGVSFSPTFYRTNYKTESKRFQFIGRGKSIFNAGIEKNKCDDVAIIHYSTVRLNLTKKQLVLADKVKLTIERAI
ncbi:hypothetical protein [Aliivibrio fischeri]|uniref:hypothetical protein n=1 Tax=Aliivibrio fischeri TaxID=668 RepID=UPI0012D943CF|nr:hypothetical protein [Aliivibrio fischeri]MUJ20473.1 hypothetical protein [Aliivibrio fischeri]